jgi:tetraacyldisaccharide 4'-kinase
MSLKKLIFSNMLRLEPPSWWCGERIPATAWGLLPISAVYGALVERRFRNAQPYRSKLPVICVGNFTMGGAGKTPVALKLASMLRDLGRKPGFLTRGYGGTERGPHRVNPDLDVAARVGDEPLLLAASAPTVVSRNRPLGARFLETLNTDVIIVDDGFQNPSLAKDFSLIAVDTGAGIGSGRVFPLGPLRARLGFQARMAGAVILLSGEDGSGRSAEILGKLNASLERMPPHPRPSPAGGEGETASLLPSASAPGCGHSKLQARQGELAREKNRMRGTLFIRGQNAFEAKIVPLVPDEMRARPFLAFCGIGRPSKFFETLREAGLSIANTRAFPDHHPFTESEARSLLAEAKALKAGLITTGKDMARLKGAPGALAELKSLALALSITVEFSAGDEAVLLRAIERALASAEGASGRPFPSAQGAA